MWTDFEVDVDRVEVNVEKAEVKVDRAGPNVDKAGVDVDETGGNIRHGGPNVDRIGHDVNDAGGKVDGAECHVGGAGRILGGSKVSPANRLEALKGNRHGQLSIWINQQWRICFRRNDRLARLHEKKLWWRRALVWSP